MDLILCRFEYRQQNYYFDLFLSLNGYKNQKEFYIFSLYRHDKLLIIQGSFSYTT